MPAERSPDREQILGAALTLARDRHWEAVRLAAVAEHLGVGLDALHPHVQEKEDLADALWDRADRHMLARCEGEAFRMMDFPDQYEHAVMAWLAPLVPHRRTVREMLLVRLEPGHLHIQLPTLFRISRTVQWLRECCHRRATFLRRASEETVLSALFVTTVASWLGDESEGARHTRERLARRIRLATRAGQWWPGP